MPNSPQFAILNCRSPISDVVVAVVVAVIKVGLDVCGRFERNQQTGRRPKEEREVEISKEKHS